MARLLVQADAGTDARVDEQVAVFLMHQRQVAQEQRMRSGIRAGQRHSPSQIRLSKVINAPDCGHIIVRP